MQTKQFHVIPNTLSNYLNLPRLTTSATQLIYKDTGLSNEPMYDEENPVRLQLIVNLS